MGAATSSYRYSGVTAGYSAVSMGKNQRIIEAVGQNATEGRQLIPFGAVQVVGLISVRAVPANGHPEAVVVDADRAHVPCVVTSVEDSQLTISIAPGHTLSSRGYPTSVQVTVYVNSIWEYNVGAGSLILETDFQVPNLSLILAGGGTIRGSVTSGAVNVAVTGNGRVCLGGQAQEARLTVSGNGRISAENLLSEHVIAVAIGPGSIATWANLSLTAQITGSGDIRYRGSPVVYRTIIGSGYVWSLGR